MNPDFTNPSSIPSIKRLARAIRQTDGRRYSDALETAARRAGFRTFREAQIACDIKVDRDRYDTPFTVKLLHSWRDRDTREFGTTELALKLSQPLSELAKPHYLRGRLSGYRLADASSLVSDIISHSEDSAKWWLVRAARSLQFMDATGLRPSSKHRNVWPRDDTNKRIPDADHFVVWYHPKLKKHVITDEPYHGQVRRNDPKRSEWCGEHGYVVAPVDWSGMHNPSPHQNGGTVLYLIARAADHVPLEDLAALANRLPESIDETAAVTVGRRSLPKWVR